MGSIWSSDPHDQNGEGLGSPGDPNRTHLEVAEPRDISRHLAALVGRGRNASEIFVSFDTLDGHVIWMSCDLDGHVMSNSKRHNKVTALELLKHADGAQL
eukprot:s358_g28.t1